MARSPTIRQKKLAEVIIENSIVDKPLNAGQMLAKVGYAKNVVEAKPGEIIQSEGVQQALEDFGFTEDNAKRVVSEILLNEKVNPGDRINAAKEVFKVRGTYAPEKSVRLNIPIPIDDVQSHTSIQENKEPQGEN